jgi:hypothetical protein
MKASLFIVALLLLASSAFATPSSSPTATPTATVTATTAPTPAMNAQYWKGPNFVAPLSQCSSGQALTADVPAYNGKTRAYLCGPIPLAQPSATPTAGNPFVATSNSNPPTVGYGGITLAGTNTTLSATCSGGSTGVSIAAASTNNRGQITTSSSASTNCTITWSSTTAWPTTPFCVFVDANASITPIAFSVDDANCNTTSCKFDFASASSEKVNWLCF